MTRHRAVASVFYVVEGSGEFLYDMLRYDGSFPAFERHSLALRETQLRATVLEQPSGKLPERQRWASFGWRVTGVFDTAWDADRAAQELLRINPAKELSPGLRCACGWMGPERDHDDHVLATREGYADHKLVNP